VLSAEVSPNFIPNTAATRSRWNAPASPQFRAPMMTRAAASTSSFLPYCGRADVAYVPARRVWQCKTRHPKAQFSIKVGTIFRRFPDHVGQVAARNVDAGELQKRCRFLRDFAGNRNQPEAHLVHAPANSLGPCWITMLQSSRGKWKPMKATSVVDRSSCTWTSAPA
jgi:hypothetical protein